MKLKCLVDVHVLIVHLMNFSHHYYVYCVTSLDYCILKESLHHSIECYEDDVDYRAETNKHSVYQCVAMTMMQQDIEIGRMGWSTVAL